MFNTQKLFSFQAHCGCDCPLMSFAAVRFGFSFPDLTASERLTLLILGDRANAKGCCFPGQEYLAERTGLAVRTIREALSGLEAKGAIRRAKRYGSGGRTSDEYCILLPAKSAAREPAKSAAKFRQNVPTIPTTPNGVSNNRKKKVSSRAVKLEIVGGTEA